MLPITSQPYPAVPGLPNNSQVPGNRVNKPDGMPLQQFCQFAPDTGQARALNLNQQLAPNDIDRETVCGVFNRTVRKCNPLLQGCMQRLFVKCTD
jgi:hypothetical protein